MNINASTYFPLDASLLGAGKAQAAGQQMNNHEKSMAEVKAAAEDFEAFFLSKMTETMFEGISTDGMFGGGNAEKVYRSLLLNEYGKAMAKTGTVGVADYVMNSILEMQEAASVPAAETKQEV